MYPDAALRLLRRPDRRPALRVRAATSQQRGDLAGAADLLRAGGRARARLRLGLVRARRGPRRGSATATAPSTAFRQARAADPEDRHGARLQLARLDAGEATPRCRPAMCARCSTSMPRASTLRCWRRLDYRGPRFCSTRSTACARGRTAACAFRPHARSRLRHRARRRGVRAARRLARRRRSLAGDDRAGARARACYDRLARRRSCSAFLARESDGARTISSIAADVLRLLSAISRRSSRAVARVLDAGRPVRLHGRDPRRRRRAAAARRCATPMARTTSARRWPTPG